MINTRARQQLNTIIDSIQQAEIKELEQQRKKLMAYMDSHKADMEEDTDIATAIRGVNNYLSDRAEAYITTMNRIGKLLTGRDAVAEFIDTNGLPYVECRGCEKAGKDVPIWQKYTLSIDEAALYFKIGRDKLRKIIAENPDADFVLWNRTRAQIKRKKFEEYIDRLNVL